MTIKGPLLLWFGMGWRSKVFFYFDLELLEWWSKVIFYFDNLELLMSIKGPHLLRSGQLRRWSKVLLYFDLECWDDDQRSSYWCQLKVLLYFDLECWDDDQRSSSTLIIWNYWCRLKVLLYFDLECWDDEQRSFPTSIWSCNVAYKKSRFRIRL